MEEKTYLAIDLKSFYASVECLERGLDPLKTNLVVADPTRTEKTICLAVSPSLKAYGIPGRARLFEVVQRVREVNARRLLQAPGRRFAGKSAYNPDLQANPGLELDYVIAKPQMAKYMSYSAQIYQIYLQYVAPEDIFPYSVDEVFIDATDYLTMNHCTPKEFAMTLVLAVLKATGITATAGIGTNMYLCKVAMDIDAKHIPPDANGVRIAELNERTYRERLWHHRPLTDFWRVGPGYAKKLEAHGMYTMGDVARRSMYDEKLLYQLFGVNAELLIDHAWGWEPCTIADVKAYKPRSNSISSGQVLQCPYPADKAKIVVREMADMLALDLVDKGIVTDQLVLTLGYDTENVAPGGQNRYRGEVVIDRYGRKIPKHAHGTANLERQTASAQLILAAVDELFDRIIDPNLTVRRINLTANHLISENDIKPEEPEQLQLFVDYDALAEERSSREEKLNKEKQMQKAVLGIKKKYGKNAILKGMNYKEGATAKERNRQIGGHKA